MPEIAVTSLDPRHQKLIDNARIALERGQLDYTLDARLVAPTCAGQVPPEGSVEVRAEHEGLVVDLTTAPLVDKVYDLGSTPYEVDVADVAKRLDGTKTFDLVLRRVGAACRRG